MKLYEHEAKKIIATYGVPTPRGAIATDRQQVRDDACKLGGPVVMKAQVLTAGRGKAGGILFAQTPSEAYEAATNLFGSKIKGETVSVILVEETLPIKKELYFGITVDRLNRCYVAVASQKGGADIEEVAELEPQKIFKHLINPWLGFRSFHTRQIAQKMGYRGEQMQLLAEILEKMYRVTVEYDAELLEMNPIVETHNGKFYAADARLILDDNSLFRHEEFKRIRLQQQRNLSPDEFEALKNGLEYVKFDGDIGVAGNGAGLVMATLDMINLYGGKPANFLDMGGGAPPQRIKAAFKIVLSNPQVKVLFVNILGGITQCDEVASGIVQARKQLASVKPIFVRLVGTNEQEGRRILEDAGLPVFESMEEAAKNAVSFARKVH